MEELRTSSYIIPVKLEKEKGKYMLIHGYTGAIDIIEEKLFNNLIDYSSNTIITDKTKQSLIARGYLTYKSQEEEYTYVVRLANALHQKDKILYKFFTWIVTYNCNFRCPYCFECRDIKDSEKQITFTKAMVDKAYLAMEKIEPRKELRNSVITLYGGEPLLKENKEIVAYIVEEGCKRGYKFMAVTNGYDLENYIDLLSPEKIFKLQITIDGTKELHNQKRIHVSDHNTFDKILSNIELVQDKDIKIAVRVNTDNQNVEDFFKLNSLFKEKGLTQNKNFKLYSALLRNNTNISLDEKKSLDFLSVASFFNKHKEMGTISMCMDYSTFNKIHNAISTGKPIPFSSVFCASQSSAYVLDPLGHIYPCWETIGEKKFQIGNYSNEQINWDYEKIQKWQGRNISSSDKCKRCKYALFCGGGCSAHTSNNENMNCSFFYTMFKDIANRAYERFTNI